MHRQLLVIEIHGHGERNLVGRRDEGLKTVPSSGDLDGDLGLKNLGWGWLSRGGSRVHHRVGEPGAVHNHLAQFWDGDPLGWVAFEDTAQNVDHLRGQGQDGLEEERILEIGPESGILERGAFPGVATTGQVDQHHAETPDVIGG